MMKRLKIFIIPLVALVGGLLIGFSARLGGLASAAGGEALNGGAVFIESGASYTMSGGQISNNSSASGGGLYLSGEFNMTGGTITQNSAENGGGIYISSSGKANLSGGSILSNSASGKGSSIYNAGEVNLNGVRVDGEIYNAATLNFYSCTLDGKIILAPEKYITLKAQPESQIMIECESIASGTIVAKLDGISSVDISLLNVINLPSGLALIVDNGYIKVGSQNFTIKFVVDNTQDADTEKWTIVTSPLEFEVAGAGRYLSFANVENFSSTTPINIEVYYEGELESSIECKAEKLNSSASGRIGFSCLDEDGSPLSSGTEVTRDMTITLHIVLRSGWVVTPPGGDSLTVNVNDSAMGYISIPTSINRYGNSLYRLPIVIEQDTIYVKDESFSDAKWSSPFIVKAIPRKGYKFVGWFNSSDALLPEGEQYSPGTVYAKFEEE